MPTLRNAAPNDYNKDFYKWVNSQAKHLKKNEFSDLDIKNLVEEIESLGRSDKRSLRSHLIILLQHMLKLKYQPEKSTKSWLDSISNALIQIELILDDSPSLKRQIPKMIDYCYSKGRDEAIRETKLKAKIFPEECPWGTDQILQSKRK